MGCGGLFGDTLVCLLDTLWHIEFDILIPGRCMIFNVTNLFLRFLLGLSLLLPLGLSGGRFWLLRSRLGRQRQLYVSFLGALEGILEISRDWKNGSAGFRLTQDWLGTHDRSSRNEWPRSRRWEGPLSNRQQLSIPSFGQNRRWVATSCRM